MSDTRGSLASFRTLGVSGFIGQIHDGTNATGLTPGSYTNANITVGTDGRITAISSGGGGTTTVVGAKVAFSGFITEAVLTIALPAGWNQWIMNAAWTDVGDNGGGYHIVGATQFNAGVIEVGGTGTSTSSVYGDAAALALTPVTTVGQPLVFNFQSTQNGEITYSFSYINAFNT